MAFSTATKIPPLSADASDTTLIGSHCQDSYCNQLDFLPFKCDSCHGTFCLDHRSETAHKCPKAGEWARKRAAAQNASSSTLGSGNGGGLGAQETLMPCTGLKCKVVTSQMGRNPGVVCETCRRMYCLNHRLKEDHDCKNLVPLGLSSSRIAANQAQAKTASALSRLRLWGKEKKSELEKNTTKMGERVLPKSKPSSATARMKAVNELKKTAKGDEKLPMEKRVYLFVEAEAATTTSKFSKGQFFFSKDWAVGRVLDEAARKLQIENVNNQNDDERQRLRVFHVEGGRLLEFSEKVGASLVSGNTIVLLKGVGPATPNLIEC